MQKEKKPLQKDMQKRSYLVSPQKTSFDAGFSIVYCFLQNLKMQKEKKALQKDMQNKSCRGNANETQI